MNRLLALFLLLVAGVGGLGFYLGWWNIGSNSVDNKANITLTVDKDKIQQDEKKAMDKVKDLGHPGNDKPVAPAEGNKDLAGPPTR